MREYASNWAPPGGVFDMHAEMMELTLRIASKTLFGADAGEETDRVGAALHEVVTIFPTCSDRSAASGGVYRLGRCRVSAVPAAFSTRSYCGSSSAGARKPPIAAMLSRCCWISTMLKRATKS